MNQRQRERTYLAAALRQPRLRDYKAKFTDPHHGATEPLLARPCKCESPGLTVDDDARELRCWRCGRTAPST